MEYLGAYANQIGPLAQRVQKLLGLERCSPSPAAKTPPKRATRLAETDEAEVARKYQQGQSVYALADEYGIHRTTISTILKRQGVNTRYNFMTEEMITQATRLRQQGLSYKAIGQQLGVTDRTVYSALKRQEIP